MPKSVVIVESPAKAKTLEKFLGRDFKVLASYGHVRDLPRKGLGVDREHHYKPSYELLAGKEKTINDLKKAAKTAENGGGFFPSSVASTVQYSIGTNASISFSRSQMILKATVCTRPAERPLQIFLHRRSETS